MNRTRAAWIDVDLDHIVHNVNEIKALAERDSGRKIAAMPVIKGNAYGHGIYEVAAALYGAGYRWFGVAVYSEARLVRQAAPEANILILGATPDDLAGQLIQNRIIPAVYTLHQAQVFSQKAAELGMTATIHIKVDTGMHRIGFRVCEESADAVAEITRLPHLNVEGIFTHFATSAMREKSYVYRQYEAFETFMGMLDRRGVSIPLKHISNTGIILDTPQFHQDMIRFGSMVFGTFSSLEVHTERVRLKDAFSLRAEVAYVKDLAAGEGISYDLTYTTSRPSRIATLPLGYADIGIRRLRNKGFALIRGKRAPIVGSVCMDQLMLDVTDIDGVCAGDVATLIGSDGEECLSIREVAELLDTDGYELIISAQHRLPVRYWKNGALYRQLDTNLVLCDYYKELERKAERT